MKRILSVFLVLLLYLLSSNTRHNARAADCIYGYKAITIQCSSIATGAIVNNNSLTSYSTAEQGFHCTAIALNSIDINNPPSIDDWNLALSAAPADSFYLTNKVSLGSSSSFDLMPFDSLSCPTGQNILLTVAATSTLTDECYSNASFQTTIQCPSSPPPDEPPIEPPIDKPVEPTVVTPELQTPLDIVVKAVTSPSIVTAVTAAGAVGVASLGTVASNLVFGSWQFFFFLPPRRRKKKWGRIVEAGSNVPMARIKVQLLELKFSVTGEVVNEKVVATTATDDQGYYAFAAAPGKYHIDIPEKTYKIDAQSPYRVNQVLEVSSYDQGLVVPDIWIHMPHEALQRKRRILGYLSRLETLASAVSYILLGIGTYIAVDGVLNHYNHFQLGVAIFYGFFWTYMLLRTWRTKKNSPWGRVMSTDKRAPVPLTLVRIVDTKTGRLMRTVVSDENGRFNAAVGQSRYRLMASSPGYVLSDDVVVDIREKAGFVNKQLWMDKIANAS